MSLQNRSTIAFILVRIYNLCAKPFLGENCRFHPTCSEYFLESVSTHGWIRGLGLTGWRLMRCQPYCRGGDDPVPTKR